MWWALATAVAAPLTVRLPAIVQGGDFPVEYTCSGENASPQIVWGGAPTGTVSYALIVDDPDAKPTWVHWVAFNILPTAIGVARNVTIEEKSFLQGKNDFGHSAWGGPCPPEGKPAHRYYFRAYALDTLLTLSAGATRAEVDAAMEGHILAQGTAMGRFGR